MILMGSLQLRIFYDFMTLHSRCSNLSEKKEIQINHTRQFIRTASHEGMPGDNKNIV